ncbi:DUF3027 domain-containing protein [Pseudarthrobacter enclensis]|uniref:DUF3027 domain-containing protein n=1 Tax=Pseudarthrobacter enclensis TaxID=993070 RepID=UPI00344A4954
MNPEAEQANAGVQALAQEPAGAAAAGRPAPSRAAAKPATRRKAGVPVWRTGKPDAFLAAAADIARTAIEGITDASHIGPHLAAKSEGDRLVTHLFESRLPGYAGWQWFAVLTRNSRSKVVTVSELGLLPSEDSILAPEWVPWAERVRPEDEQEQDAEQEASAEQPGSASGQGDPKGPAAPEETPAGQDSAAQDSAGQDSAAQGTTEADPGEQDTAGVDSADDDARPATAD